MENMIHLSAGSQVNEQLASEEEELVQLALNMSLVNIVWTNDDTDKVLEYIKFLEAFLYVYIHEVNLNNQELFDCHLSNINTNKDMYMQYRRDIFNDANKTINDENVNWSYFKSIVTNLRHDKDKILRILEDCPDVSMYLLFLFKYTHSFHIVFICVGFDGSIFSQRTKQFNFTTN